MPCKPLESFNIFGLTEPNEVLKKLDTELLILSAIAADTDFSDAGQALQFKRNIIYVKQYFERYERLIRESPTTIIAS
jgi:hypothetical protein